MTYNNPFSFPVMAGLDPAIHVFQAIGFGRRKGRFTTETRRARRSTEKKVVLDISVPSVAPW
jgi:hypothetical protein